MNGRIRMDRFSCGAYGSLGNGPILRAIAHNAQTGSGWRVDRASFRMVLAITRTKPQLPASVWT
jgi:hypothetical protein